MTKTEKKDEVVKGGKNTINVLPYYDAAILVTFNGDTHFPHVG
jgi:hypothetical protein